MDDGLLGSGQPALPPSFEGSWWSMDDGLLGSGQPALPPFF